MTTQNNKLIERVARAIKAEVIWPSEVQFVTDDYRRQAQAALEACHAEELADALSTLVEAVRMDLGLFPDQPHKDSALGRAEQVLAKLEAAQ